MAEHEWVHENLDTYLAGDLTTAERENVERHVAACEACQQALTEARRLEQVMHGLFRDARPSANLDDRIIGALGKAPPRPAAKPTLRRYAVAAAAVLVAGLVGAAAQAISNEGGFTVAEGLAMEGYRANSTFTTVGNKMANAQRQANMREKMSVDGWPGQEFGSEPGYVDKANAVAAGLTHAGTLTPDLPVTTPSGNGRIPDQMPLVSINSITEPTKEDSLKFKGKVEERGDEKGGKALEELAKQQSALARNDAEDKRLKPNFYGVEKMQESKEATADLAKVPDDKKAEMPSDPGKGDKQFASSGRFHRPMEKPIDTGYAQGPNGSPRIQFAPVFISPSMNWAVPNSKLYGGQPGQPPAGMFPGSTTGMSSGGTSGGGIPGMGMMGYTGPVATGTVTTSSPPTAYFPLTANQPPPGDPKVTRGSGGGGAADGGDKGAPPKGVNPSAPRPGEGKGDESPDGAQPPDKKLVQKAPPAEEAPIETSRKIIRTGEMEFEIDSFDKAVDNITKLITAVKGGFVATINSDKLPNGKMKGAIVVRMPPQFLDKFVLELRRELAKAGELKNQRIISLDVTKQYTDIESRLRAARTMEERLIQIIKVGKGEIKDLVAAERELGVWRTKIEEMEGEIRYYGNQVSLSTLTISLYEKEILAPTAIVVTDSIRMRLEVEDVAKAHQTAMAAVEEMKGRITRSELKQHAAGQLQSILCADIPPAKKDAFRDLIKKLGILSDHEENQQQHTEGGIGKGAELKPRMSDVHFDVTMHNTANVMPRLSADLKVATSDVPAAYQKLLDAIAKAKGQVRDGKLNEQDKLNITALIDFNVPSSEKPAIDAVLLDIGPILERVNLRAPISALSTERKFGYTVTLRDFASIPPSKAIIEIIALTDVPAGFAKLQDAVAKAKGQIANANLNEQDKLNINAQLDFTVLTEEKAAIDALLKDLGTSLSRVNVQAPMNQLSTARKFGFTLALRDFASIPPTKGLDLKVAVTDVPASYAKLVDAIARAKGLAADVKLNEADKLHITAQLIFTVPAEEKTNIDKLLAEIGTVLSRNNVQTPVNQLSTAKKFGYALDLRDFVNIPPSKASEVTIAASNVPGNYAKVIEAIAKAKGQVRDGKLNEADKLNVTAQIDFTVPSAEKPALEALLGNIGTILSRKNVQVPVNELSTESKFGYSVVLRDFANIPPRDTFLLQIALPDVSASFRELQDAVVLAKGWVNVAKLVEDNKAKIEAQFDFDVPVAEKAAIEKLLGKTGAILIRTSSQVPVNEMATDQKVGYRVTLRSIASIPPREKTLVKFEVTDVDAQMAALKEIVLNAKGRVVDSNIDRQENGQVTAAIVFEVPFAAQDMLLRQMKGDGRTLVSQRSTRNPQVPENELTTAHIIVTLAGGPIVPNDKGIGAYVRTSLGLSFQILAMIVMTIIVGLSGIVPCVLLIWIGFKLYAVMFGGSTTAPTLATASGPTVAAEDDKPGDGDAPAKS